MILTKGKTDREVFEEIAAALVAQGGQCKSGDSYACLYGDGKGRHCAVGWLLPEDDEDLMDAEGSATDLLRTFGTGKLGPNAKWIAEHCVMLNYAQDVHDYPSYDAKREDPIKIWDWKYPDLAGVWDDWLALRIEQSKD